MFDYLRQNMDAKTLQKLKEQLNTPEGRSLMQSISEADKQRIMAAMQNMDMKNLDFTHLNAALQNADVAEIIRKLKGGK